MRLRWTSDAAIKRAEGALQQEREFTNAILRSSSEAIVAFDRDLRCTLWNPAMEQMTGISAEHAVGRSFSDVFPSIETTDHEMAVRRAVDGVGGEVRERPLASEGVLAHRLFDARYAPLRDASGEIIGGLGFMVEATDRHRIEETLRQAQKMEAVGQMTGGIAHDFNNMLTIISGNLERLESKLAGQPTLLRIARDARAGVRRAEKLTKQLLAFSRKQPLSPEPLDLNELVLSMFDLLVRTIGDPRVTLSNTLAPELDRTTTDRNQLEAALLNLVLNARDAMPAGGRIEIATSQVRVEAAEHPRQPPPGRYVVLSVSDNGQGMSAETRARACEPFYTTKEAGKGTGLGLSMTYGFVHQSGGHLELASQEGQGTTVRIYLPITQADRSSGKAAKRL